MLEDYPNNKAVIYLTDNRNKSIRISAYSFPGRVQRDLKLQRHKYTLRGKQADSQTFTFI